MPYIFQCKNILRNFKTVWFIVIISILISGCFVHRNAAEKAQNKSEQIKIKQKKEAAASEDASKRKHFKMQSKKVQARMKDDERKTSSYYNKKLGRSFFSLLFGKKKRR
jgi:hypothetical protein